jgi:hypothetical protein
VDQQGGLAPLAGDDRASGLLCSAASSPTYGNTLRHGLVTDIHHEFLDKGEDRKTGERKNEERAEPLPRLCDECKAVLPARSIVCSECGATRVAKTTVVHKDGELVEFGSGRTSSTGPTLSAKCAFFGELKWIAADRGYQPEWMAHKFKERFGEWPDSWIKNAEARPPTLGTRNWTKSRQIAFARSRAARHG